MKHSSELTRINRAVNSLLRRDKGGRKEEEDNCDPIAVESLRIFNDLPLLQKREVSPLTNRVIYHVSRVLEAIIHSNIQVNKSIL